jgi:ribosome modulation factor
MSTADEICLVNATYDFLTTAKAAVKGARLRPKRQSRDPLDETFLQNPDRAVESGRCQHQAPYQAVRSWLC